MGEQNRAKVLEILKSKHFPSAEGFRVTAHYSNLQPPQKKRLFQQVEQRDEFNNFNRSIFCWNCWWSYHGDTCSLIAHTRTGNRTVFMEVLSCVLQITLLLRATMRHANEGPLTFQDGCVPLAQCGCLSEQQYIVSGQKFYPKPDCMKLCECRGGMVSCEDKPCQKGKSCGVRKGVRGCYDNIITPGNKG